MTELFATFLGGVTLLNRIIATGILITAFALVIYIGLYNRRSQIARAFAVLLVCAIGTYLGDLLAQLAAPPVSDWLRAQWVGIALMPAAALHLSDTLLRATGDTSPIRRNAVKAGYLTGAVVFLMAAFTDLVAAPGGAGQSLPHMEPGVLFYVFSLYYFSCIGWAAYNVIEARRRSLTSTSKRRMTYFTLAFPAPTLGIFPFLMAVGWPDFLPSLIPWLGILVVNVAIGAAITLMGYTVAYFGASAPDRVIKRRLIKYLIRGPVLAAVVITALVLSSRIEKWVGLPGDFIGLIAAATIILLTQLFIVTLQPTMDRLIAGEDAGEVRYLQQFSERLMTTSDLRQFMENILAALCDLLRARTAFVMRITDADTAGALSLNGSYKTPASAVPNGSAEPVAEGETGMPADEPVLVSIGNVEISAQPAAVRTALLQHTTNGKAAAYCGAAAYSGATTNGGAAAYSGATLADGTAGYSGSGGAAAAEPRAPGEPVLVVPAPGAPAMGTPPGMSAPGATQAIFEMERDFIQWDGYWLIPLRAREAGEVIGVIGLVARASEPDLTNEERQGVAVLVAQTARALEDALKQRRAFEALERIIPEADDMQRHIAETRNPAAPTLADFELAPEGYDDFTHMVRDALSQFWGGPKLANSPLIKLRVVTDAMEANNGNATKALRAVLTAAIERLKPDGTRSLTATEWLLYNILEMKILRSQRVRDVARQLVMSESDLYRKQRAAFEEVARIVLEMEREARSKPERAEEKVE